MTNIFNQNNKNQEGVIKFKTKLIPDQKTPVQWQDIETVRKALFQQHLIGIYKNGPYKNIGFGNISCRYQKNPAQFIITGSQTGALSELKAQHYCLVTDVNIMDFQVTAKGAIKPSSEAVTHYALYKANPEIQGIIHAHAPIIWAILKKRDDFLFTKKDTPYGSRELVTEIQELFTQKANNTELFMKNVIILRGHEHGIFVFGQSIAAALKTILNLQATFAK